MRLNVPILSLLAAVLLISSSCRSHTDNPASSHSFDTGNADFDRMLALSVTIAEELLKHDESFVPFATAVKSDGQLTGVLAMEPQLTTSAAVNKTVSELVRGARTGAFRSTAMCTDVIAPRSDGTARADAIAVLLEDEGESRGFILPYSRSGDGRLEFGTPYFRVQRGLVFRRAVPL